MKYIFIHILFLKALISKAQTIIEGHVTDDKKNDLIKATVRCYSGNMYICGTTTNSKGEFKLEVPEKKNAGKININYIGYKETAITINPTDEKHIRLGDIAMGTDDTQLQEVTVLSSNRIRTEDKTMIFPTKDEIRHAYDGYSALDVVRIPGLNVNTFNSTVAYHNQDVLLCIDGRQVSKDEVQDLNPKDIKRIDLYTQGTPEYPDAYAVLDYILKERDYAGSVAFNALHNNRPNGNGKATVQYFEGKSEFTVSASGSYNHFTKHDEGVNTTTYHFPEETITRTDYKLPSPSDDNSFNTYANYLYKDKKQNLHASLRFNRKSGETDTYNKQTYSNIPATLTRQEHSNSQSISPSMKLQYSISLPHKQRLRIEAYGSYGNNHYNRWYESRTDETVTSSYGNGTLEDSYYMNATANYTKTINKKSSLNLTINHNRTHTEDENMRNGTTHNLTLNKNNTKVNLTYKYSIRKKFSIQANLAGYMTNITTGGKETDDFFFVPYLRMTWMLKKHTLNLSATSRSHEASNSNRTGDEYRINEYEMFVGNPELKDYVSYNATLNHDWEISKRITWIDYLVLRTSPNSDFKTIRYDNERGTFVNKTINIKKNWSLHYETGFDYEIIPNTIYMRALFLGYWSDLNDKMHNDIYVAGSLRFQHKGWRAWIGCISPTKGWDYLSGKRRKQSAQLDMNLSYSINNWNIGIAYSNPFKTTARSTLVNGEYEQYTSSRIPRITDNYGYIRISHRFTFGKKKHKFDTTEVEDVNQTTISQ